jgi:hypothetical protein
MKKEKMPIHEMDPKWNTGCPVRREDLNQDRLRELEALGSDCSHLARHAQPFSMNYVRFAAVPVNGARLHSICTASDVRYDAKLYLVPLKKKH